MQTFQIVLFYEFPYSVYVFYVYTICFDTGRKETNETEVTLSSSEKKRLFPHGGPNSTTEIPLPEAVHILNSFSREIMD